MLDTQATSVLVIGSIVIFIITIVIIISFNLMIEVSLEVEFYVRTNQALM